MENVRYKVLVIEDDKVDQMAFQRFVKENNNPYDYTIAGSVTEAIKILNCQKFDIVISDYLLGDGTTFDIFDLKIDTPIIVTTGSGDEEIAVRAMKAGASDYLIKDQRHNYLKVLSATAENVVKLKKAEKERESILKELEAKNSELERFAYTVSHCLRSPLITVQGFVKLLREDLVRNEKEKVESDLKYIENSATKMDRLLTDTLQLSRIGHVTTTPEDVSFLEIIQEVLEQTAEQLKSSGVEVSVADDFPTVHVDRMRMEEVLVNLITNSINYRGEQQHPKIDIGYRVEGEETVFFVADNGVGIDKNQHEKVFEFFYKLDMSSKGTGVGLDIVKRIIEVHGGRIWIESEKGKGCTVCFTLPEH